MKRDLTLKKDTLTELGTADLTGIAGGSGTCYTCVQCVLDQLIGPFKPPVVSSVNAPCHTV